MLAAKSTSDAYAVESFPPDPNSQQSTISTVEREIREDGGEATAVAVDTRDFDNVKKLIEETIKVTLSLEFFDLYLTRAGLWSNRCRCLQFGSNLVGVCGEYAHGTIPAYATRQPRRPLWNNPSGSASFQEERLERSYHCRFSSNLLSILSGQDSIRHGKGGDECLDQGLGYGF